ncbi:MAG: ATP-binding protein [Longimicrobiales bacterium]
MRQVQRVEIVAGTVLLGFGLAVLAGWTWQIEALIRPLGPRAMQGVAGAGFVLLGGGIVAAALGSRRIQMAAGAASMVLGAARILALFTGLDAPRLFFWLDPVATGLPLPSTMAPNSAVVFLFGGLALVLLSGPAADGARQLGGSMAAALVLLVGLWDIALVLLEEIIQAPLGGQMAPQMALGALVAGVGLARLVAERQRRAEAPMARLPLALGVASLVGVLAVAAVIRSQQQQLIGTVTGERLAGLDAELDRTLAHRRTHLRSLSLAEAAGPAALDALGADFVDRYPDIIALALIDEAGRPTWQMPAAAAGAGSVELRENVDPAAPVTVARDLLSGEDGRLSLTMAVPGSRRTMVSVHDVDALFRGLLDPDEGYGLVVRQQGAEVVSTADLNPGSSLFVKGAAVGGPTLPWTLEIWPTRDQRNRLRAPVAMISLLVGVALSYLLAVSAQGRATARRRSGELAAALASLEAESSRRQEAQTALAETRERLREAEKMDALGRMAGGIAHDFNNLLTVIQGHVGLLQDDVRLPADTKEQLAEVEGAASLASTLTRQLLTFSARGVDATEAVELAEFVEANRSVLADVVGPGVVVSVHCERDLTVMVDPAALRGVLVALASNAGEAIARGRGGRLHVTGRARTVAAGGPESLTPGEYACLTFRDDGPGMPPEVRERVFEPFFSTRDAGQSAGLGLPTVYGFARQAAGAVSVSSHPGQGTEVSLLLPLATSPRRPSYR